MARIRRTVSGDLVPFTPEEEAAADIADAAALAEQQAIEAERTAQEELHLNLKADAVFDQLKQATATEINTFVNNQFGNLNATQRSVIKLMLQYVALQLRKE